MNAPDLKSGDRASDPWVRIPPHPPQARIGTSLAESSFPASPSNPPAFSPYIRDEVGATLGVRVTSLANLANRIRTLSPRRIELVCGDAEDSASLRRDLVYLVRTGAVH